VAVACAGVCVYVSCVWVVHLHVRACMRVQLFAIPRLPSIPMITRAFDRHFYVLFERVLSLENDVQKYT